MRAKGLARRAQLECLQATLIFRFSLKAQVQGSGLLVLAYGLGVQGLVFCAQGLVLKVPGLV